MAAAEHPNPHNADIARLDELIDQMSPFKDLLWQLREPLGRTYESFPQFIVAFYVFVCELEDSMRVHYRQKLELIQGGAA